MSCHVKWSRCLAYSIVTYDGELCDKFALGFNPSPFRILVPASSLLGGFLDIFVQKPTHGFLGNSGFGFKLHCQDSAKFLYPWNCQPGHIVCSITLYNMHPTGCLVTCDLQQKQKLYPQTEPNISWIIRRYDDKLYSYSPCKDYLFGGGSILYTILYAVYLANIKFGELERKCKSVYI